MRYRSFIGIYLCILAAWMQLLAPAAALSMERPIDPLSVICAQPTPGSDDGSQHHHHKCDHCLLCHAYLGGLIGDGRPDFTAFDYPAASPLRWRAIQVDARPRVVRRASQPRGPPQTI